MKRLGLIAIAAVAASCGPPTNILPVNDFNRPTDVAFMCFGAFPQGTADGGAPAAATGGVPLQVSGRPLQACHPQNEYDPGATTQTRTFAFLPNSAAGTLTAVDADHWKLVDLNLDTGGYGTAPLGQLPEQISASDDGCRLISANRGSCDLTLVNPSILVAPTFQQETGGAVMPPAPRTASQTFRPIKGDGTLLTAPPYEAVFLPQDTSSLLPPLPTGAQPLPLQQAQLQMCGDNAAVAPVNWPSNTNSWYALVTYPSCDLITLVELPSGQIKSAAYVRKTTGSDGKPTVTLVDATTSPVCSSASCAGQALPPSSGVTTDAALRSDAARSVDALGPAPVEAGVSDGAAPATDAGSGGAAGAPGTTGAGGAPGTGGTPAAAGASGSADAGATGGSPGGTLLGNQYPDDPYFGPGPLSPSGIAIIPDGSRAYVSLANASFVVSVGLTNSGLTLPGNGIWLHEGARGSSRVRLNVDPNRSFNLPQASGTDAVVSGVFVGAKVTDSTEDRQFLYVIARDGTLRVVSVFHAGSESECETNIDPLFLPAGVSSATACIPVDPSHRRPFSVGPGIHFPSLPIDVAAADIQNNPPDTGEQSVNGAHAWVITDSGIVYLVNLNPVLRNFQWSVSMPPGTPPPLPYTLAPVTETPPFVNTLRDRNETSYSLTLDPSSGPPRVDVLPSVPVTGPYVEPFWAQGSILNPTAVSATYVQTVAFFPQEPVSPANANVNDPIDRRAITAQTWTIAWEGALSGVRNSGVPLASDAGKTDSVFQDGGVNYCALGVVQGDLVTLTGCTDNTQCGLGEECVLGDGVSSAAAGLTVTGICVDPNRASAQTSLCADFLNSVRRYEVESASPNSLVIRPHLDEIVLSSLTPPCNDPVHPTSCPDVTDDLTSTNFKCVSSYPGTNIGPRCLMPCALSSDCRAGRLCVDFDTATTVPPFCARKPDGGTANSGTAEDCACTGPNCFCADAPPFDHTGKACFDQLVNYQVNAGKTFLVAGSQAGFVTTAPLPGSPGNSGTTCAQNPTPDARFSFRIPMLGAPTCSNPPSKLATIDSRVDPDAFPGNAMVATDASTLVNFVVSTPTPDGPCLYLGGPTAGDPLIDPTAPTDAGVGADGGAANVPHRHVRALFQNSQLSFVLANIDRAPSSQFVTSFDVHGGFATQVVQDPITLEVSMPARIVLGPVDSLAQVTTGTAAPTYEVPYLFVVDQHRLGREQGGGPTRGQLLRINPLGYSVTVGSAPVGYQPIFEDYNASGGLFPIQ